MENISFVRYSPRDKNFQLTAQLVECYRAVFSDRPWNEWLQCPACKKYWGTKDQTLLASWKFKHCNSALVDFWSREQVISDLYHEITPETSCWLAVRNGTVIGFCWGYQMKVSKLEDKLGIEFDGELKRVLGAQELVAYQDEVGVLSDYRGHKIAKAMVVRRLNDFLAQDLRVGIVRTRQYPEPSETFLWYKKINYHTLAVYPKDDGRVILGRNLDDLTMVL